MKIALSHNRYLQRGGEDTVVDAERKLLSTRHEVRFYETSSQSLPESRLQSALVSIWNHQEASKLKHWLETERPDILHVHNTFPYLSSAVYWAAAKAKVPVVQTLHNYRRLCLNGLLFRDGQVCMDCVGHAPLPGIVHSCYRKSRAASATMAGMIEVHRALGSDGRVHRFLALTEFAREVLIRGGLPTERLTVKPNFVEDRGVGTGEGGYALFVGRVSAEKGVDTLLKAWYSARLPFPLKIAGDGPESERLQAESVPNVEWLGHQPAEEIARLMKGATLLIFPSEWFEGMPMTVLEAYSAGTPVVASRIGALESLVKPNVTGLHFTPGDSVSLAQQVQLALDNPELLSTLRRNARAEYEQHYTPQIALENLERVYREVLAEHRL